MQQLKYVSINAKVLLFTQYLGSVAVFDREINGVQ